MEDDRTIFSSRSRTFNSDECIFRRMSCSAGDALSLSSSSDTIAAPMRSSKYRFGTSAAKYPSMLGDDEFSQCECHSLSERTTRSTSAILRSSAHERAAPASARRSAPETSEALPNDGEPKPAISLYASSVSASSAFTVASSVEGTSANAAAFASSSAARDARRDSTLSSSNTFE